MLSEEPPTAPVTTTMSSPQTTSSIQITSLWTMRTRRTSITAKVCLIDDQWTGNDDLLLLRWWVRGWWRGGHTWLRSRGNCYRGRWRRNSYRRISIDRVYIQQHGKTFILKSRDIDLTAFISTTATFFSFLHKKIYIDLCIWPSSVCLAG